MPAKSNGAVRVSAIRISNVLGIQECEIFPGTLTLIEGRNGSGKTSILDSIRAAMGGGTDATLLRKGAESGEVVLLLDNGVEITKQIGSEKSRVLVSHPDVGMISKGQTYLDKLTNDVALNPVLFLTAKPSQRADLLLDAIPMEIGPNDLKTVLPLITEKPNFHQHALKVIGSIQKDIYDQRTGVNRSLKDKKASVSQLRESLPPAPADGSNWKSKLLELRDRYLLHQKNILTAQSAVRDKVKQDKDGYSDASRRQLLAVEGETQLAITELERQIHEIREKSGAQRREIESALNLSLQRLNEQQGKDLDEITVKAQARNEELTRDIAQAEAMVDADSRTVTLLETIENMESGVSMLDSDSQALSAALDQVQALKSTLLEKLPIPGIEIKSGEIFVDDIPFDRLNESRKVRLAIEIAKLRLGQLRIVIVDGLEKLDANSFEAFREEIKAHDDVQFIVTRVSDGPLTITEVA